MHSLEASSLRGCPRRSQQLTIELGSEDRSSLRRPPFFDGLIVTISRVDVVWWTSFIATGFIDTSNCIMRTINKWGPQTLGTPGCHAENRSIADPLDALEPRSNVGLGPMRLGP